MSAVIQDDPTARRGGEQRGPVQRDDLPPGYVIHEKYRVVRRIGIGGMGVVYEVVNENTGKRAALKVMLAHKDSGVNAERFKQEAKAPNEIDHPGVVDTLDADEDPRCGKYIVMELLEGETLADVLQSEERWPSVRRAVDLTLEILDPLAAAHRANRIHRDLKPENIFLHRDRLRGPITKIMDFGLVRDPTSDKNLTQQILALGTLGYMSPEQIVRPASVQATTDVWAVGVMLYEMLAHQRPFPDKEAKAEKETGLQTLNELCDAMNAREYRRIDEHVPGLPARLVELVHRCLEPRPDDRPKDAGELRARLLEIREVEGEQLSDAAPARAEPRGGAPGSSIERRGSRGIDGEGGSIEITVSAAADDASPASAAQLEPTGEVAQLPGERRGLIRSFAIGTAVCACVAAAVVFVIAKGEDPPATESRGEVRPPPEDTATERSGADPASFNPPAPEPPRIEAPPAVSEGSETEPAEPRAAIPAPARSPRQSRDERLRDCEIRRDNDCIVRLLAPRQQSESVSRLVALIQAYRALGRNDEALQTKRLVVRRFPDSGAARRYREELGL